MPSQVEMEKLFHWNTHLVEKVHSLSPSDKVLDIVDKTLNDQIGQRINGVVNETKFEEFAKEFYAILFELAPEVSKLFHDRKSKVSAICNEFSIILELLKLKSTTQHIHYALKREFLILATTHRRFNITESSLELVGHSFLATIRQGLGYQNFDPETASAWKDFLTFVTTEFWIALQSNESVEKDTMTSKSSLVLAPHPADSKYLFHWNVQLLNRNTKYPSSDSLEIVETSWNRVTVDQKEFSVDFYDILFEMDPKFKSIFEGRKSALTSICSSFSVMIQLLKLQKSISTVGVTIEKEFHALAESHKRFNITAEMLELFGHAFLATVRQRLGMDLYDPETANAWREFLTFIMSEFWMALESK